MNNVKKLLNMAEIYSLLQEFFVILPDIGFENTMADAHKREIRRIIQKRYDTSRTGKTRTPVLLSKQDALKMIMYDDDIRRYFLRHMQLDAERIQSHFLTEDAQRNSKNAEGRFKYDDELIYSPECDSFRCDQESQNESLVGMQEFLLNTLFGYPTFDDLLKSFDIDAEKYKKAYLEWMELKAGDQPYPIRDGFSELDYKLHRPTIYFHKD